MSRATTGTLGLLAVLGIMLALLIGCLEAIYQLTCDQWTGETLGKRDGA